MAYIPRGLVHDARSQALSYKIGQLEILKLRQYAQDELKEKFSLRAFHDEVLGGGALPLDVLSQRIHAWVARQMPLRPQA
jgi:uncharacterized protein (DUF885 family)